MNLIRAILFYFIFSFLLARVSNGMMNDICVCVNDDFSLSSRLPARFNLMVQDSFSFLFVFTIFHD